MTPQIFSKGGGQGHVTPYIFRALNANSSEMVKPTTDIKFDMHVFYG